MQLIQIPGSTVGHACADVASARRDVHRGTAVEYVLVPCLLSHWALLGAAHSAQQPSRRSEVTPVANMQGEADATWVFMPWEGVEASRKGVELNAFRLSEAGIPYGYSPVVVATTSYLRCGHWSSGPG